MNDAAARAHALDWSERVLVLAPTAADANITRSLLADARLECTACGNPADLSAGIAEGAGAVLLTDETLSAPSLPCIVDAIRRQPMWSDLPVLLMSGARTDASVTAWALESLGNVTVLERPVRVTTLVSALRSAIRGRRRQYQLRDQLDELAGAETSLRRHGERLRLLWEAASQLLASDDADGMTRALFGTIAPHLALDACLLFTVDDSQFLRLRSWAGITEQAAGSIEGTGTVATLPLGAAADMYPASFMLPPDDSSIVALRALGMRACAGGALVVDGRRIGTLGFGSARRDDFDPEEVEFLRTIADCATLAYERLRLIGQLRERDRRKDEFLATLAHELRNPLAPIGNALEIMRIAAESPSDVEAARQMAERQLKQLVRLIDDLMDVSRITRGKLGLRRESVALGPVVDQAIDIARPLIDAGGHHLEVELPGTAIVLEADAVRLAQVLSNLLNNAARYTERGGRIRLCARAADGMATIIVQDTGIGIPAGSLRSIFELFTQVDRSLEKKHGGLGIGLTLVKHLTEMHGGTVEARSSGEGCGSEFIVRLPLARVRALPEGVAPMLAQIQRAEQVRRRVLVADDNRDAAESMGHILRLMGHDVRMAHDGEQAVASAREFRPELALLDIGMPEVNGYEAARRIRAEVGEVMLVAVTGWGQEQDRRRAMEAGFDRHYTKPLRPADLEAMLATLQTRGARPELVVTR